MTDAQLLICLFLAAGAATAGSVDLIADVAFQHGFAVKSPEGKVEGVIRWGQGQRDPVWQIAQWHGKTSLYQPDRISLNATGFRFKDEYKELAVHPGSKQGDVVMGVNAFAEYGGRYRRRGDLWPHLYISQRISSPRGHLGKSSPPLSRIRRVDLSLAIKMLRHDRRAGEGLNPRMHAAQFLLFFTVQNLNRQSPGFGDYFWFGINMYDDREEVTKLHVMADKGQGKKKGTGKLIYNIGVEPFHCGPTGSGQWVTIRGDLYPHMVEGLKTAWQRGFLVESRSLDDYYVGGFVLGFEVTGLNDIAFALRGLRATAWLSDSPEQ